MHILSWTTCTWYVLKHLYTECLFVVVVCGGGGGGGGGSGGGGARGGVCVLFFAKITNHCTL